MRPVHNPYGGTGPLIDKMIGNAYDIVKYVARYLKEIRYVAENMETVFTAANGNRTIVESTADGSNLVIDLPEDMDTSDIQSISALAVTESGDVYLPGADTFNFGISLNQINISINSSNIELMSAQYKVQITTE